MQRDTRQEILRSARRLFAENGFDGTALDAIIAASRTSKGTLYHYFPSKEHLYVTVLEEAFEPLWQQAFGAEVLSSLSAEEFWPALAVGVARQAQTLREHVADFRLLRDYQRKCRGGDVGGPISMLRQRYMALVEDLVRLGQNLGTVRQDLSAQRCAEVTEALAIVSLDWFASPGADAQRPLHSAINTLRRALEAADTQR